MAEHYIKEMRTVQPEGPYFLGGFSAGGLVAYEMARQLHEAGERVPFLALFDSYVEAAGGYWLKSFYSRRALRMSLLALRVSWHSMKVEGLIPVLSKKLRNMGSQYPHHGVAAVREDFGKNAEAARLRTRAFSVRTRPLRGRSGSILRNPTRGRPSRSGAPVWTLKPPISPKDGRATSPESWSIRKSSAVMKTSSASPISPALPTSSCTPSKPPTRKNRNIRQSRERDR